MPALLAELASVEAALQLMVTSVNSGAKGQGPQGNWTPERLAQLQEKQNQYSALMREIAAHTEAGSLVWKKGRIVGRPK